MKKKPFIYELAAATEGPLKCKWHSHLMRRAHCSCAITGSAANDASCKSQPVAASLCEARASIGTDSLTIRRGPQGRGYSATDSSP